ncbi:hypothetical protein GRF29_77g2028712 [Pseudopithomyces chartarum]|uniref:P450 monooxygenase n=1 Tax=Pseudopithomyces chartarum TaxID=1892770 RepID=A0AAN6RIU6_9PLEO|nr:hypothetical protein GRF29_77g2028712 [Pseudopithomyces chartarum]
MFFLLLLPLTFYLVPLLSRLPLLLIPGPLLAKLSNLWLMYQCRRGKRYLAVHSAHQTYGKVLRIAPNHISIADASAIPVIYGHGKGLLKADYYDAFVSITRGLFNTRDRAEHTRKRKAVAHTFSAKAIGQFERTLGCLPQLKPYAAYLPDPFFTNGIRAINSLAGIAIARVNDRLSHPSPRVDLLSHLIASRDEAGNPLGRAELTAEALTQLIAGSDTTSNTSCALLYHCLATPHVIPKLVAELDAAIPDIDAVPSFAQVRDLPYLDAVIKETMRIHSTSSLGLPRVVPPAPASPSSTTTSPRHRALRPRLHHPPQQGNLGPRRGRVPPRAMGERERGAEECVHPV